MRFPAELAGIKINIESKIGIGEPDVEFSANIKGIGIRSIYCEFKNAHSPDLSQGFVKQLPAYMSCEKIRYGIYCVMWFKGKEFKEPMQYHKLSEIVSRLRDDATNKNLSEEWIDRIRVLGIDLSQKDTASRS